MQINTVEQQNIKNPNFKKIKETVKTEPKETVKENLWKKLIIEPEITTNTKNLIPGKHFFTTYIKRTFEDGNTDFDWFDKARFSQQNVLLSGPTGPGKTSSVLAYAALNKLPVVRIMCNGAIEPTQLLGSPVPSLNGKELSWQEGILIPVLQNGGIIYLDEINFMPPRIASAFHSLLDKERKTTIPGIPTESGTGVFSVKAHDACLFVGSYNPGYEGTRPLNAAFKNRFPIKLFFGYDNRIESKLVKSQTLIDLGTKLRAMKELGELNSEIPTNLLQEFEDNFIFFGIKSAQMIMLNNFSDEERLSVKNVFSLMSKKINSELFSKPKTENLQDETVEKLETQKEEPIGFRLGDFFPK